MVPHSPEEVGVDHEEGVVHMEVVHHTVAAQAVHQDTVDRRIHQEGDIGREEEHSRLAVALRSLAAALGRTGQVAHPAEVVGYEDSHREAVHSSDHGAVGQQAEDIDQAVGRSLVGVIGTIDYRETVCDDSVEESDIVALRQMEHH